ncbi:MAG: hypothetical protein AUK47_01310 [Deltaproteobacteria bacterium CG2_30_63_29]|nr:MAG: hypothetical protein AUK47_01310 [Deltaproteobacteria bacterium CG2_30_63_29]PIW02502.1 MAG: hypothetical protein COW42_01340 [Deltaproteobacteria bacterium CG17_big_fil_post_rev_8_21_14_2_50_63_7]PJB43240.1 MAG: hypothetical protein CO108_10260 [Deltaproteobacteria bacterium CG_4_9_14_3_um_filter_63_12]
MSHGRNEPCHCGSGKKYKQCCQGKPGDKAAKDGGPPGMSNGKLIGIGIALILLISAALWLAELARLAQILGAGMVLVLILGVAFRRPPSRRETPGDASGISFGK